MRNCALLVVHSRWSPQLFQAEPFLRRALVACGWFGLNTWLAASAIHALLAAVTGKPPCHVLICETVPAKHAALPRRLC